MIQRNHSEMPKILRQAARIDLPHHRLEKTGLAEVQRAPRRRDDDVQPRRFNRSSASTTSW